jgi:hypothetical protein
VETIEAPGNAEGLILKQIAQDEAYERLRAALAERDRSSGEYVAYLGAKPTTQEEARAYLERFVRGEH